MSDGRMTDDVLDIDIDIEDEDECFTPVVSTRLILEDVSFHISSLTRHLQHNGQLSDPTNRFVREMRKITSKTAAKKTDADWAALEDLEWEGGLYVNEDGRVCVPGLVLEGALWQASKHFRMGTLVRSSVLVKEDPPLIYNGPKTIAGLKADPRFRCRESTKNPATKGRVMRTRPKFDPWELKFTVHFRPDMIDRSSIINIVKVLGSHVGLSDDRSRMGGRFNLVGAWDHENRPIDFD